MTFKLDVLKAFNLYLKESGFKIGQRLIDHIAGVNMGHYKYYYGPECYMRFIVKDTTEYVSFEGTEVLTAGTELMVAILQVLPDESETVFLHRCPNRFHDKNSSVRDTRTYNMGDPECFDKIVNTLSRWVNSAIPVDLPLEYE